ncbi:hypothetical protein [Chitinophaga sp.]|uniref:hypothetical protein n=1 Tax=Chitinophaga sp. TaxID=1869181 RepID=UPI0026398F54|nr:hypothetical protein [uncultured Chitinophaga sp.]
MISACAFNILADRPAGARTGWPKRPAPLPGAAWPTFRNSATGLQPARRLRYVDRNIMNALPPEAGERQSTGVTESSTTAPVTLSSSEMGIFAPLSGVSKRFWAYW